ncbi:hypothetical protein QTP88_011907 [Uroleucon formosanum]
MERNYVYKIGMIGRTARLFLHYVYYNPRIVCRVMAAVNGIFFMVFSMILVNNILWATYFKRPSSSTSEPSQYSKSILIATLLLCFQINKHTTYCIKN